MAALMRESLINNVVEFYIFYAKKTKNRESPCVLCGANEGNVIGRYNYMGLNTYDAVQCLECGLISLDDIPDIDTTIKGCELNTLMEYSEFSKKRIIKGYKRAYRRGGYFARNYMSRIFDAGQELNVLEIGAGSGYFSQGVKHLFKNINVHYLDIVKERVEFYKGAFDCDAVAGEFGADAFPDKKFDLIIARDLIEHLSNPLQFFRDVNACLKKGGYFFFITPNGRENIWECNQRYMAKDEASLMRHNHYYYYLPETLDRLIEITGFDKQIYFKWGLKRHRRGLGHKKISNFSTVKLPKIAGIENTNLLGDFSDHNQEEIFYSRLHGNGLLASLYSNMVDRQKEKVDYYDYKGHEFFVFVRKKMDL